MEISIKRGFEASHDCVQNAVVVVSSPVAAYLLPLELQDTNAHKDVIVRSVWNEKLQAYEFELEVEKEHIRELEFVLDKILDREQALEKQAMDSNVLLSYELRQYADQLDGVEYIESFNSEV